LPPRLRRCGAAVRADIKSIRLAVMHNAFISGRLLFGRGS
jgi:hypothetical protein